ncbi:hypothetical protein PYCCODRAFT_545117 [Trametes coccinea BRFM310]|uniref:Uncharacterized protein n=1 Tax=Trametes coccinea (strain BRFM310) TaxID=1353009 RepID=A0A1Y2ILL3_TRAC3|nr:hypothetical protein PYCCODRAFT_545117 [Trametes coccinea BRFM310]
MPAVLLYLSLTPAMPAVSSSYHHACSLQLTPTSSISLCVCHAVVPGPRCFRCPPVMPMAYRLPVTPAVSHSRRLPPIYAISSSHLLCPLPSAHARCPLSMPTIPVYAYCHACCLPLTSAIFYSRPPCPLSPAHAIVSRFKLRPPSSAPACHVRRVPSVPTRRTSPTYAPCLWLTPVISDVFHIHFCRLCLPCLVSRAPSSCAAASACTALSCSRCPLASTPPAVL